MSALKEFQHKLALHPKIIYKCQEPLAKHTTLRIGGPTAYWVEPGNIDELQFIIAATHELKLDNRIIGGGSNLLISERDYTGVSIHLRDDNFGEAAINDDDSIRFGSGMRLNQCLKFLIEHGYADCEFLAGIPANVGGAIAMNAGSGSTSIGDYVCEVEALNKSGVIQKLKPQDIIFSYRSSNLLDKVIVAATLKFPKGPKEITRQKLDDYANKRKLTQDLQRPSAGCMFANPETGNQSAGALIEA
ncbi:MAG: UDP-N-acetylmuramate dehydrogenase, partial [Candidatus Omnitrophota bacterium]